MTEKYYYEVKMKEEFNKKFWIFGWTNTTRVKHLKIDDVWYVRVFGGLYMEFIGE